MGKGCSARVDHRARLQIDSADVNSRFQRIHQSLGGADPVPPPSSPGPAALGSRSARNFPLACPPRPRPQARFLQTCRCLPTAASHENGPFLSSLGRAPSQDQLSGRADGGSDKQVPPRRRAPDRGCRVLEPQLEGPLGDRGDTKARRGRALFKVTRLAERTRLVRRLGSCAGP